jgi:hypothetical protein
MGWNKDGSTVKALYLSQYECIGTVKDSRVSYGGRVLYTLDLDEPLALPFTSELRDTVIVSEDQVVSDFGVLLNT